MSDAVAVGNGEAVTVGVELDSGVAEAGGIAAEVGLTGVGRGEGEHELVAVMMTNAEARCQAG